MTIHYYLYMYICIFQRVYFITIFRGALFVLAEFFLTSSYKDRILAILAWIRCYRSHDDDDDDVCICTSSTDRTYRPQHQVNTALRNLRFNLNNLVRSHVKKSTHVFLDWAFHHSDFCLGRDESSGGT